MRFTNSANTRGVGAGSLDVAAVHLGGLMLPWLAMLKPILALVVTGGLSTLLRFTAWGRRVRATSDDLAVARLQRIRVRPLFAAVTGIAIAAAAPAGTLNAVTTGVYPTLGALTLIFAFEAVIIGGLGSLWGTLVGGMLLGITQIRSSSSPSRRGSPGTAPGIWWLSEWWRSRWCSPRRVACGG